MGNLFSGTNASNDNVDQAPVVVDSARHPFATIFLLCLQAKSKFENEEDWARLQIELLRFANEHKRILVRECPKEYCAFARCTPPSSPVSPAMLPDQEDAELEALKFVVKHLMPLVQRMQSRQVLWGTMFQFFRHHTAALSIPKVKRSVKKKTIEFFSDAKGKWKEQLVEMSRVVWPNISVIDEDGDASCKLDFADASSDDVA